METELYHYGVKGMRWGVRRYRNHDGSLTSAGKKQAKARRYDGDAAERNKQAAKKVAIAMLATASVAAVTYAYAKNHEAVNEFVAKAGKKTVSSLKSGSKKAFESGKTYVKEAPGRAARAVKGGVRDAVGGFKTGVNKGIKEAPEKAGKTIVTGVTMLAAKRMLDAYVGKEEAERIFKANNGKKIDSFWKVQTEDKSRDDD